jgi:hypothetical protein
VSGFDFHHRRFAFHDVRRGKLGALHYPCGFIEIRSLREQLPETPRLSVGCLRCSYP